MADLSNRDIQKLAQAFAGEVAKALSGSGGRAGSAAGGAPSSSGAQGRSYSGGGGNIRSDLGDVKLVGKSLDELKKYVNQVNDAMKDYTKKNKDVDSSMTTLLKTQTELSKSFMNHERMTNDRSDAMKKKIQEDLENVSHMGKGVKEFANDIKSLGKTLDETEEFLDVYRKSVDDLGRQNWKEITTKQKENKKYSEVLTGVVNAMKVDKDVRQELIDKIAKGELQAVATRIEKEKEASEMIRKTTAAMSERYTQQSILFTNLGTSMGKFRDSIGAGFLTQATTFVGALALAGVSAKRMYDQFWTIASSGLGANFIGIAASAVSLGVAQEAYVKSLQENANIATTLGLDGYSDMIANNQKSLMRLGLSQEEAMKTTTAFARVAQTAGINVGDTAALQTSIKQQTKSFNTLRAITGVTAEQFAAQNQSLLDSGEFREKMTRLDRVQRRQVMAGISAERERLALLGLSNDQQLAYIKSTQSALNQAVETRFEQGADLITAATALGMGGVGMEAQQILLKGGGASDTETARLNEIVAQITKRSQEAKGSGDLATEALMNATVDKWGGALGQMRDQALGVVAAEGKGVEAPKAKEKAEASVVPAGLADIRSGLGKIGEFIKSPMVQMVASLAGMVGLAGINNGLLLGIMRNTAVARMAGKAGAAAKSGAVAAKGKAKSVAGTVKTAGKSALKTAGSVISKGAKFLPGVGVAVTGAFAVNEAMDAYGNAAEIFETEQADSAQKIAAALGGAASSLSFGLIDTKSAATTIDSAASSVSSAASSAWSWMTGADEVAPVSAGVVGMAAPAVHGTTGAQAVAAAPVIPKVVAVAPPVAPIAQIVKAPAPSRPITSRANMATMRLAAKQQKEKEAKEAATATVPPKEESSMFTLIGKITELIEITKEGVGINGESLADSKRATVGNRYSSNEMVSAKTDY